MSSDETYLESFIESISTLPSEIRRNLVHIKSLDKSYKSIVDELREREEDYLHRAQEIITRLPVRSAEDHHADGGGKRQKLAASATEDGASPLPIRTDDDGTTTDDQPTRPPPSSPPPLTRGTDDDAPSSTAHYPVEPRYGVPVPLPHDPASTALVVPTTEELRAMVRDRAALVAIAGLRRDARLYSEEKIAVADQTFQVVDEAVRSLEVDLEKFEAYLKTSGCFETTTGAQPDDLAAIQVTPNSPDWILAKVISHDNTDTGMYKLSDEDIESNKTFTLPESQVVILGGVDRLSKSDIIYAVYPDTTSFYQATVVQAPRKVTVGESFVMVNFKDDGDENGITHDKAVLMKHIMRAPYGAIQ